MVSSPDNGAADVGLLSPAWAGTEAAALTSDRQFLQAMLDVELAWVEVLAGEGLVSAAVPAAVAAAAQESRYDAASIAERAQGGGNPVIPLLADMRRLAKGESAEAAAAIHRGATSQDILDTAMMLMARRTLDVVLADTRRAAAALADLATAHAATLNVARTLTQHSLPSTFGLKAAQWLAGVAQAGERLQQSAAGLPVQWGGAAGTVAALTTLTAGRDTGPLELAARLADRLQLADPPAPWQTNRLAVTGLAASLQDLLAAAGKVANDVLLLSRLEIAELSEPRAAGRGGSSAMPQKQNPVLSVLIRSAALSAPGYGAQLELAAASAVDERPDGGWHVEWQALRQLLRLAGGAAAKLAELAEGLQVHPERMRANLELTGPLVVSEKVMAQVAPLLDGDEPGSGKAKVQALVAQSLAGGPDFAGLLRKEVPQDALSDRELSDMLDPANYLGQSAQLIERIVAQYQEWSSR